MDGAKEPSQLDGEGGPKVGVDGPRMVCDGCGLREETGASRYLRMERHPGREEIVCQLVRVGASDAGADW